MQENHMLESRKLLSGAARLAQKDAISCKHFGKTDC